MTMCDALLAELKRQERDVNGLLLIHHKSVTSVFLEGTLHLDQLETAIAEWITNEVKQMAAKDITGRQR